jgi:hypothetical protein
MNAQVGHCIEDSERKFRTGRKRVFARSCFVGIAMVAGATAATASCDNRPGTPNNVTAQVLSSNSINFSWRNTTGHWLAEPTMFFDMYLQHGGKSIGRDLTGTGPFSVSFGSTSSQVFNGASRRTPITASRSAPAQRAALRGASRKLRRTGPARPQWPRALRCQTGRRAHPHHPHL